MKIEANLFILLGIFLAPVGVVYGLMTHWSEPLGWLGIFLLVGLSEMIGIYFWYTGRRVGARPEDRLDAEIHEGAGEQGHFSPWSWWPLVLGISCATGFLGLAVGWWIVFIAGGLAIVALVGWVYEYSRGDHAH
ncbi:cytochrome c oxidase subunit 4 [Arthrobacter sp. 35W]|uniref:cytochrome c oxidase subunit 4 n=1 Tax=Arthrobacter sp. 35W TaxID=1132441 RepID=UPI0004261E30|nr:cytochrome c oxidase subunit 4 [Arthrobacter sp. 35W]